MKASELISMIDTACGHNQDTIAETNLVIEDREEGIRYVGQVASVVFAGGEADDQRRVIIVYVEAVETE